MAYNFRFHEGKDVKGWEDSSSLNEVAISAIKDPNGAHSSREITSIPSPFARIDLVKTAFKEVVKVGLDGDTIYHKLVSDALDIGQIFFESDKYSDKIEIISWDKKADLNKLLNSQNPSHKLLGESLRLYLEQDQSTYNFDKFSKLYLINYKDGPNPVNIIGGTSPATLFFTSANNFELDGFHSGKDILLDDDYTPLFKRDPEYIKYLFSLREEISGFTSKMKELNEYLDVSYKELNKDIKSQIAEDNNLYSNLPDLNIDGGGEIVKVLMSNLKRAAGKEDIIKKSDFVIKSKKAELEEYPPLVLPNETYSEDLKYVSSNWDSNAKAPNFDKDKLVDRTLPFDGNKYPYLTISDLLEPVLIRTEYKIDKSYFYDADYYKNDDQKGILLPLKPLFFEYFSVDDLINFTIGGKKIFELKTLSSGYIEAILRIPVQKGYHVTFRRIYNNPVNQAHKPQYDEKKNKGAITENKINLGISPFYKFPKDFYQEYNVALYEGDIQFSNKKYELNYFDDQNEPLSTQKVLNIQRRFKDEETYNMFGQVVRSNFDYIQLKHDYASAVLIPRFYENTGGTSQFDFSIDFGTTNTHIEYAVDRKNPKPLEIEKNEKYHIGSLISFKEFTEAGYLAALRNDLMPEEIISSGRYKFPQRTAVNYHKKINFKKPLFSLGNISIPFKYEQESFALATQVRTNLKWNTRTEENQKILKSFFEELIKIIRNKLLICGGDLENTQITWSYPASMLKYQLNLLERDLIDTIYRYLGNKVKVRKVCESLTPYYYYYKYEGIPSMEKPLVSIDIGGGTSDVAIYKEDAPILFSSYRFAGDAIFGDNFNRNININGFVNKYYDEITELLNENRQLALITALNGIKESDASHDVINVFFSLKENKALNDKDVNIDFLNLLKKDDEFKVIFLLFYLGQIYHVAQLIKAKKIDIPGVISFSGTASKLLTILDSSIEHNQLRSLATEVFKYVFKPNNSLDIDIKLPDNPKEISSKGGVSIPENQKVELDDIRETLIVNSLTQFDNGSKIRYQQVYEYENKALNDFDDFLNFFFDLNKKYSYRDNFGIDKSYLDFTKDFLNKRKVNALKTGIKNKLSEISDETDEEINETIFFYPLVGTLGELAYKIQSDKGD